MEAGVIEPSSRELAIHVMFATKKYGRIMFCIDYRSLKGATIVESYPMPILDDCMDSIGDVYLL